MQPFSQCLKYTYEDYYCTNIWWNGPRNGKLETLFKTFFELHDVRQLLNELFKNLCQNQLIVNVSSSFKSTLSKLKRPTVVPHDPVKIETLTSTNWTVVREGHWTVLEFSLAFSFGCNIHLLKLYNTCSIKMPFWKQRIASWFWRDKYNGISIRSEFRLIRVRLIDVVL